MTARIRGSLFFWTLGLIAVIGVLRAAEPPSQPANPNAGKPDVGAKPGATADQANINPAIKPKPLHERTIKGLEYLVNQQDSASGGWGQGGGWRQGKAGGRVEGDEAHDRPDVGSTCAAMLALIRSGSTPKEGRWANNVAKGFAFVCEQVEKADTDSLYVTDVRDTQLQIKIGSYVDTFLTALVLSELKGQMGNPQDELRLTVSLKKTIAKIERNQQKDGTFAGNHGWASVLSQAVCTKALNRAAQKGVAVDKDTLARDFNQAVAGLDVKSGEFKLAADTSGAAKAGAGALTIGGVATYTGATTVSGGTLTTESGATGKAAAKPDGGAPAAVTAPAPVASPAAPSDAGVQIYSTANNANRIQELANTNIKVEQKAREVLADKAAPAPARQQAQADLATVATVAQAQKSAVDGVIRKLDDPQFLAGFGNNGGEEFLSYMNLSETLLAKGGPEWLSWDRGISENLRRVQNQDGSWSGQHCITGRTFCTAAALLTLMADRAPVPLAGQVKGAK